MPTLLIHPTADTEIRVWQAKEIVEAAGADDVTYIEMKGALHYLEGRSVREISEVIECSPNTVKVHLHKGRKKLADKLGVEGGFS